MPRGQRALLAAAVVMLYAALYLGVLTWAPPGLRAPLAAFVLFSAGMIAFVQGVRQRRAGASPSAFFCFGAYFLTAAARQAFSASGLPASVLTGFSVLEALWIIAGIFAVAHFRRAS